MVFNVINRALSFATKAPAYLKIFQVSTASVSFIASSIMATMIAWPGNGGLSTPYRRIAFGLSISDILQSFALMTGPLSVPSSVEDSWGQGNDASCRANGFVLSLGGSGVMMYTFFLSLYYLCKLKCRMTDEVFKYKVERKVHAIIVVYNLGLAISALALDIFHTNNVFFSFCSFASTPTGCLDNADIVGECDPTIGHRVSIFITIGNVAMPAMCYIGIIVTMSLLFWHANSLNRLVEKELSASLPTSLRSSRPTESVSRPRDEEQVQTPETPQEQVQHLSRLYRRETMIQASCYVGAFSLSYMPMMIGFVYSLFGNYVHFLMAIGIFFYPLGGVLNILVYTRPKVANIRRSHPEISRLRGLWLVLKAGGEIPNEISPSSPCCCTIQWTEQEEYEDSSIVPQSIYLFPHSRGGPLHSIQSQEQRQHRPRISSFFYKT